MNIFNSLGSNYDFQFILQLLRTPNIDTKKLKETLETKYQGKSALFYKGRHAIQFALQLLNLPKNSAVAVNGYTCFAVYEAISRAGLKTEFVDITVGDLNFSAESLEQKLNINPSIKAVIIQNTLGTPCDIKRISEICKQRNLILIEDLAHSPGTTYAHGIEAGTVGDFVALSFSQDKMIDAVSGGALVVRNPTYRNFSELKLRNVSFGQQFFIDSFYPIWTFLIRKLYAVGLGKLLHQILKSFRLLSMPMQEEGVGLYGLAPWYAGLAGKELEDLEENIKHRRKIARVYASSLDSKILVPKTIEVLENSTNLRFPILISDRSGLIAHLKQYGVYVSDIWYDAVVAPKKYMTKLDYKGDCPNAERVAEKMLNLPTHRNINVEEAQIISKRINQWLASK
jgi:dTDP-4-amino-4,6-dideoxygalactose transaminase